MIPVGLVAFVWFVVRIAIVFGLTYLVFTVVHGFVLSLTSSAFLGGLTAAMVAGVIVSIVGVGLMELLWRR